MPIVPSPFTPTEPAWVMTPEPPKPVITPTLHVKTGDIGQVQREMFELKEHVKRKRDWYYPEHDTPGFYRPQHYRFRTDSTDEIREVYARACHASDPTIPWREVVDQPLDRPSPLSGAFLPRPGVYARYTTYPWPTGDHQQLRKALVIARRVVSGGSPRPEWRCSVTLFGQTTSATRVDPKRAADFPNSRDFVYFRHLHWPDASGSPIRFYRQGLDCLDPHENLQKLHNGRLQTLRTVDNTIRRPHGLPDSTTKMLDLRLEKRVELVDCLDYTTAERAFVNDFDVWERLATGCEIPVKLRRAVNSWFFVLMSEKNERDLAHI